MGAIMKRILLAVCIAWISAGVAVSGPGDLDPSFGVNGISSSGFTGYLGTAVFGIAVLSDGTIVTAGNLGLIGGFSISRYNSAGVLQTTQTFSGEISPAAMAVQSDGKILVAGTEYPGNDSDFVVYRILTNDTLDTTFDGDGKKYVDFGGEEQLCAIALQSDGKILAGGNRGADLAIARLNSNGTLDSTFDTDGKITTDSGEEDTFNALAIQSDGKIVAGFRLSPGTEIDMAVIRYNTNGSVDNSFGASGIAIANISSFDVPSGLTIQTDGKILQSGYVLATSLDFAVVRYNTNGTFDTTFSGDGKFYADFAGQGDAPYAVAIQADGKILIVGVTQQSGPYYPLLLRITTAGVPDTTFDGDGFLMPLSTAPGFEPCIAFQTDGKIVLGGSISDGNDTDDLVQRLTTTGAADTTFDGDGMLTREQTGPADDIFADAVIQKSSRIVAAGQTTDSNTVGQIALIGYQLDGTVDPAFGNGGKVVVGLPDSVHVLEMALQKDGKIVVLGQRVYDPVLARFNENGDLDTSFGGTGVVILDLDDAPTYFNEIAVQPDGKILIGGSVCASICKFALARVKANGTLDGNFGNGGSSSYNFGAYSDMYDLKLQMDGGIVAVGEYDGATDMFLVARFKSDGSLDKNFGGKGYVHVSFPDSEGQKAYAVALQPDGKILAGGFASFPESDDFALARLNSNGSLDTTFDGDGLVTTATLRSANEGWNSLVLQPDGMILAGGTRTQDTKSEFIVARYNRDGSVDTNFGVGGFTSTSAGYDDDLEQVWMDPMGNLLAGGTSRTKSESGNFTLARFLDFTYLMNDDFEDGVLSWTTVSAWQESNGSFVSSGSLAVAAPPANWFPSGQSTCTQCTISVEFSTTAGAKSRISIEGWVNGPSRVQLVLKLEEGTCVLKQYVDDLKVASKKGTLSIAKNKLYRLDVRFDGSQFHVSSNGKELFAMTAASTPAGSVQLKTKNTTASFDSVRIW